MRQIANIGEYFAVIDFQNRTTDALEAKIDELQKQREEIPDDAPDFWERFDNLTAEIRKLFEVADTIRKVWSEMELKLQNELEVA